jgi:hypothetical protein
MSMGSTATSNVFIFEPYFSISDNAVAWRHKANSLKSCISHWKQFGSGSAGWYGWKPARERR